MHEYERTKRLEEARLEEERRRRREELYGTGRAKAAAGAEGGEVEVEDLGAVSSVAARRFGGGGGGCGVRTVYCVSACLSVRALFTQPPWTGIPSRLHPLTNAGGGPGGAGAGAARAAGAHRRRARCVTCTHM